MTGKDICTPAVWLLLPVTLAACGDPTKDDTGQNTDETECLEWYWADQDGDGYGNPNNGITACEAPSGFVPDATDCDDYRAETHPDADEQCNGIDDDCDDEVDDEPVDGDRYFLDEDGDGYGGDETTDVVCEMPSNGTSNSDDCDDTDEDVYPGASETWYDGLDADCAGDDDYDQDADGHQHEDWGGDDCDDGDADVNPDAFDQPNDGVDADCSGSDPTGTAYEVEAGDELDLPLAFDLELMPDLTFVLDTTATLGSTWATINLGNLITYTEAAYTDPAWGLASYQDYAHGGFGTPGTDLPFVLEQALTTDTDAFEAALGDITVGAGADAPESGMEALYQAATGNGYDMSCDGAYDASEDVLPFLADTSDPFSGTGGQTYDASVEGAGTLGGMGFREGSFPIVVLATDYDLRDSDSAYSAPGGCPLDAGHSDVVSALSSLGGFLVGVLQTTHLPTPLGQLQDLASELGSLGDIDGDGDLDDPLVFETSSTADLTNAIQASLEAAEAHSFDEICLEVEGDDAGVVTVIEPECHTGRSVGDGALDFTITFEPDTAGLVHELTVETVADGLHVLASEDILVVVPPVE